MNTENKAIVIIQATFNPNGSNTPEFKEYSRRSNANGEAHGGIILHKYQVSENLAQGDVPHMVLVIEYPNQEMARQTFTNSEYQEILSLRTVAFKQVQILLTTAHAI